jgi:hypothetical protein
MEAHHWAGNVQVRPMRRVQEDHQMKYALILIGGAVASAMVSITIMWGLLTGIVYLMEAV